MKIPIMMSCLLFMLSKCTSWVILDFSQVKELYTNERTIYRTRWGADPFTKKSRRELNHYCNNLRVSNVYGMVDTGGAPLPPMVIAPQIPAPRRQAYELRYRYQKVIGESDPVPMFPCAKHANDGYWFLSYGFKDDYMFIFENAGLDEENRAPVFEVKGLMERSPKLVKREQKGQILEMAFWNMLAGNKPNPIPTLSGKGPQHFRLCSEILDAIRKAYSTEKVYTINFGSGYGDQSPVFRPVIFQFLGKKEIYPQAIPCAMNRSFKRPNFLVVPDRTDPNSVFVLYEKRDSPKYFVKYYIRDVSVLKNWNDS